MLSIIVADDDRIIRKGLIKIIEKSGEEFQIAGEASNGEQALDMIKKLKPDILITDIKMPVMDGVKLINNIREENIEISTVVLSGFDDYKYVRETLKGGAYDYILKPIDNAVMLELLNKIKEKVLLREKEQQEIKHFSKIVSESKNIIKEKILVKLAEGTQISSENSKIIDDFKTNDGEQLTIAVLSVDELYKYKEQSSNIMLTFKQKVYQVFADTDCFIAAAEKYGKILILYKYIQGCDTGLLLQKLKEIQTAKDYTVTIGISNSVNDINKISEAYIEASAAAEYKFYESKNKIYVYENSKVDMETDLNQNEIERLLASLANSIQLCDFDKIKITGVKTFEYIKKNKIEPQRVRKILCGFITKVSSMEKDFQSALEDYSEDDIVWHIERIDTYIELCYYVIHLLTEIGQKMKLIRYERSKKIIERAKLYIQEHFREEITLKMVADYVYLNPNYFSKLFKEEVNKNFIDYLIEKRIETAKEMLKAPGIKVYEVAQSIGYDEVVSFNRAFKKVVGVSPKEYLNLIN